MLILKHAFQHDEFLAACVRMGRKCAAGGITDDGGGACHLAADAVQHTPVHALHGRGLPFQLVRADNYGTVEICIQVH
jgi:hypothetical protein